MERRRAPLASATRSLVELLPQSSAATTSSTHILHAKFGHVHFQRDQRTHGVFEAGEIIRQVRVQTLDTHPGASHAAAGLHRVRLDGRGQTAARVLFVSAFKFTAVDQLFETMNATFTFESTHRLVEIGVD
jgi:hypothetical protein